MVTNSHATTLIDIVNQRAMEEPDVAAYHFIDDDGILISSLTYSELQYKAEAIAKTLLRTYSKGSRALLMYRPGPAFIVAFYGCLRAGLVAVPTYPPRKNQNLQRLKNIIADANVSVVLSDEVILGIAQTQFSEDEKLTHLPWLNTEALPPADGVSRTDLPALAADEMAMFQYTSGSTGSPKGVVVTHNNIMCNQRVMAHITEHSRESIGVSWLPHFHDMGLFYSVIQPVYVGFPMHLMSPAYFSQRPLRWLQAIHQYRATTSCAPNFAYDMCVESVQKQNDLKLDLSCWKTSFNSAEPVSAATIDRFQNRFGVYGYADTVHRPCYGMAEMTLVGASTVGGKHRRLTVQANELQSGSVKDWSPGTQSYVVVSSGPPVPGHSIAIVDPESKIRCTDDKIGEIWFKGCSVAAGYWEKEHETQEGFRAFIAGTDDGPYLRTGDLGFMRDGEVYVTGRCKDTIIIRGRNYYPQDIEEIAVRRSECVKNGGAAFAVDVGGEAKLVLVQEIKRTSVRNKNLEDVALQLKKMIAEEFGLQLYDVVFIKVNRLLKTSSGKIQRLANSRAYMKGELEPIFQLLPSLSAEIEEQQSEADNIISANDGESAGSTSRSAPASAMPVELELRGIKSWFRRRIAELMEIPETRIQYDVEFTEFGLDSMNAMLLVGDFVDEFKVALPPTHIYDYPTINLLASAIIAEPAPTSASVQEKPKHDESSVAIIGMACRFPKAQGLDDYWTLIRNAEEGVSTPPGNRRELAQSRYMGGYLPSVDEFDNELFSISPKEARLIDPQQRILLEEVFEALLSAGYNPQRLAGSRTGVFVGITANDYGALCLAQNAHTSPYFVTGNAPSIAANRISYYFDFKGPSLAVDTACSSSLVAVTRAVQSLRSGECDLAVVAGVQLNLLTQINDSLSSANMLSADGHCKVFDARADGYVRGEGCGVVILKPMHLAMANDDQILAIIAGAAVVQDGRTNGLNAPNGLSQQKVIELALQDANISAECVDYVEAHGTGTELGDPIELRALNAIYGKETGRDRPLKVGSVKANIGHLEAGAGMAGLIKLILCLQHGAIPKQRHFARPNPHIDWSAINIAVPTETTSWQVTGRDRYAGISSFGFGGTNAHLILRGAPKKSIETVTASHHPSYGILTLSAHNTEALSELTARIADHVSRSPNEDLWHLASASALSRPHLKLRTAIAFAGEEELREKFAAGFDFAHVAACPAPDHLTFVFTGQGSQYAAMGKTLYQDYPVFKETMDHCDERLKPLLGYSLVALLYGECSQLEGISLDDTGVTQPALFCVEYALAQLWMSWGIKPTAVLGHSVGEVVAATVAGIFSLDGALEFIAARAKLSQSSQPGGMLNVYADSATVLPLIDSYRDRVSIAAVNTSDTCVLSGDFKAVAEIADILQESHISTKKLQVSHAFHSPMMQPIKAPLLSALKKLTLNRPNIQFIDNLYCEINSPHVSSPQYWADHLTGTVRFAESVAAVCEQGCRHFLEIGPSPHLCGLGKQVDKRGDAVWLASMTPKEDSASTLAKSLSRLYSEGLNIVWEEYYRPFAKKKVALPAYPFQRKSFWVPQQETVKSAETSAISPAALDANFAERPMNRDILLSDLQSCLAIGLQADKNSIGLDTPLLEIGADSLIIVEFARKLEAKYRLEFAISQFFEELSTLRKLGDYIAQHGTFETANTAAPAESEHAAIHVSQAQNSTVYATDVRAAVAQTAPSADPVVQVMHSQLLFASQTQSAEARQAIQDVCLLQLNYLAREGNTTRLLSSAVAPEANIKEQKIGIRPEAYEHVIAAPNPPESAAVKTSSLPPWRPAQDNFSSYGAPQKQHLQELTTAHNRRTPKSKSLTQRFRSHCADSRASAGFRLSTKEMLYPIYGERAEGAKTWDIDSNEYIDITMGFGVNLFGHQPKFVVDAIQAQLQKSMQLGLQTSLSGEVAEMICELTGMSRVTFCNSGTEAVMTALRLCRAATKRRKVVQFSGSYHGHYDGTLADVSAVSTVSVPMAPGVNTGAVEDVILLEYGDDSALAEIARQADQIAAVLVEPVQSRHPELQPAEFLRALRVLTEKHGILLIFDEMITGFRILPGGAQQWFDIQADVATYGKIVGGGLPIGVVAGRGGIMDGIDGGFWQYGDGSYPKAETTFFAGTFCKHPLTMAAAHAVLTEIRNRGAGMYHDLNRKTLQLVQRLNGFFQSNGMPLEIVHFGSLFRFKFKSNLDVLFYNLMRKGLYVWEGRNCFLSSAHTDADIEKIYVIVTESLQIMRDDGFFAAAPAETSGHVEVSEKSTLPETQSFPLYDAQKQLWAADRIDAEGGLAYHLPLAVKLTGDLQRDCLAQAIKRLVERHPALRTTFSENGEQQSYQQAPREFVFQELDWTALTETQRSAELREFMQAENSRPFDLTRDLLLRAALIQLAPMEYLLVLRTHHIVADGLSLNILLNELALLYSGFVTREPADLPPSMDVSRYVELHTQFAQSSECKRQENYWKSQFSGGVPQVDLPTDYPLEVSSFAGACVTFSLPPAAINQVHVFAKKHQCTLFMALFAIYVLWLHKVSGQARVVVGFPASGRGVADKGDDSIQSLIAYCTHMVPFLSEMRADESLSQFVARTRQSLLQAYENQDYPYAKLLKLLLPGRDLARSRLINCVFNLDSVKRQPEFCGLQLNFAEKEVDFVDFDLSFNFLDSTSQAKGLLSGELKLEVEYRRAAFSAKTVERFFQQYCTLLQHCTDGTDEPIVNYGLLDAEHQLTQAHKWSAATASPSEKLCFVEQLESWAQRAPDKVALKMESKCLTYRQMNEQANRVAHYLLDNMNIGTGSRVAIYLEKSFAQITALLGVLKAGAAYIPVDGGLAKDRVRFILKDSDAQLIISSDELLKDLQSPIPYFCIEDLNVDDICANPGVARDGQDPAYLIYTSGSTGEPKGVVVPYANLMRRYSAWNACFGLTAIERPVHLQMANFSFDVFTGDLIRALGSGATLLLVGKDELLDAAQLFQLIQTNDVNFAEFVPAVALSLCDHCEQYRKNLIGFAIFIVGSDTWHIKDALRLKKLLASSARLFNTYGVTEATIDSSYCELTADVIEALPESAVTPIGRPMDNVRMLVVDPAFNIQPDGIAGELLIGGDSLASGYWRKDELTAEKFIADVTCGGVQIEKLYRTGDQAKYRDTGFIEFIGRLDHQVKIRGHRVELGEVEFAVCQLDGVRQAAVIANTDETGKKQLLAFVAGERTQLKSAQVMQAHLKGMLPDYMLPVAIVVMDQLPMTASGKLDRKKLEHTEVTFDAAADAGHQPTSQNEILLAGIFRDLFRKEHIATSDNFFSLGGDSITAIQLVSRLRQVNFICKASDIFANPEVESLALVIAPLQEDIESVVITGSGEIPPNPIQAWCYEQSLKNYAHWNQALLLTCQKGLTLQHLQDAFNLLVGHHAALKMRFEKSTQGKWVQRSNSGIVKVPVHEFDLMSAVDDIELSQRINECCDPLHAKMSLERGDLVQVAIIRTPMFLASDRLFITVNHLVIDGVSWRLLLDDLQRAVQALRAGQREFFGYKTTEFGEYSRRLNQYANGAECQKDLAYWQSVVNQPSVDLPVDFEVDATFEKDLQSVTATLSKRTTTDLLQNANRAYRTEIDELLLSAMGLALASWTGGDKFKVSLEGHGRDAFHSTIDLSHTIGWFTSVYPVILQVSAEQALDLDQNLPNVIEGIKQSLRNVPESGFSYSPLRYLHKNEEVRKSLQYPNLIEFNYLGQTDNMNMEQMALGLSIVDEKPGHTRAAENHRTNELEIDVIVFAEEMKIRIAYSGARYAQDTMQSLANSFIQHLNHIVQHCLQLQRCWRVDEYPLLKLSQEEFNTAVATLDDLDSVEDIYPQSSLQSGMLYHSGNDQDGSAYIDQLYCEFMSPVDEPMFIQAWQHLVDSHSIFRTQFVSDGLSQGIQVVRRDVSIPLDIVDKRDEQSPEAFFARAVQSERTKRLPQTSASLMRLKLYRFSNAHYGFVWTFHHAIMDGWSLANALEHFLVTYESLARGSLAPTAIRDTAVRDHYGDYIAYLSHYDQQQARAFWTQYLQGFDSPTLLRCATPQSPVAEAIGETKKIVDQSLVDTITRFARAQQVTLNSVVQAAWSLVLHTYTQSDDIVFGVTCTGRPAELAQVENRVGLYINTIPLRVKFDPAQTCKDWLKSLQKNQLNVLDYQYSPLLDIQKCSELGTDNPLLNILLVCENYPIGTAADDDGNGLAIRNIHAPEHTNFPISLEVSPEAGITLKLTYKTQLFDHVYTTQLLDHVERAFAELVKDGDRTLAELQLLSDTDSHYLLHKLNQTTREYHLKTTWVTLFEQQVLRSPNAVALMHADQSLTYAHLNGLANGLAVQLKNKGVCRGDVIPVIANSGFLPPLAFLAINKCGAAFAPLDPRWPVQRLADVLADVGAKCVVLDPSVSVDLRIADSLPVVLDDIKERTENPVLQIDPEDSIYVIHTSGSTGKPKGAVNCHKGILNRLMFMDDYFGKPEKDTVLQTTHHCYDSVVWQYFWPLLSGGKSVLQSWEQGIDLFQVVDLIQRHKVTVTDFTPGVLASLYAHLKQVPEQCEKLASLRALLLGGEALSTEVVRGFRTLFPALRMNNCYGPSETSIGVIFYEIPSDVPGALPIGRPIANVRTYVLNERHQPLPIGVVGELYLGGTCVGRGYLNNPNATENAFIPDPFGEGGDRLYRTGDLVRYLPDGNIDFVGRRDNQIKIRGHRVELGDVEAAIGKLPDVHSCCVLVYQDEQGHNQIAAFAVASTRAISRDSLHRDLRENLPRYMYPAVLELLPELPVTQGGKVDKKYLHEMLAASQVQALEGDAEGKARREPRTPLERLLCEIFQNVLQLENVDIHSDFFALGGHSLNATQVVSLVRRHIGVEIKIKDLFMHASVAQLAEVLEQRYVLDSVGEESGLAEKVSLSLETVSEEIEI